MAHSNNNNTLEPIRLEGLAELIYTIRGTEVMLDSDLASIYGVETKAFNQAVKRNIQRFPDNFRFQLTEQEFIDLRSQIVTSNLHGGRRYAPFVFTEQGVAMLSALLHSDTAIQTSIQIINAFVSMRRTFNKHKELLLRLSLLEERTHSFEVETRLTLDKIFDALEKNPCEQKQGVFFDGQVFDAYVFINGLMREARDSLILIDNYVDDTTFQQMAKRDKGVSATILTKNVSPALLQDLQKHNTQYPPIEVRQFSCSHDRFLILDGTIVYHLGASLKDLGKKWFAFSKMDKEGLKIIEKLDAIDALATPA